MSNIALSITHFFLFTTGYFKICIKRGPTSPLVKYTQLGRLRPLHPFGELIYSHKRLWLLTSHPELGTDEFLTPKGPSFLTNEAVKPRFFCLISDWQELCCPPTVKAAPGATDTERTARLLSSHSASGVLSKCDRIQQQGLTSSTIKLLGHSIPSHYQFNSLTTVGQSNHLSHF